MRVRPALVLELVGDDALEAHHERRSPPPEEEAVEIDAVDEIDVTGRAESQPALYNQRSRVWKPVRTWRGWSSRRWTQRLEPSLQPRDAHEGATPLPRIRRRGGEDGDAQELLPFEDGLPLLRERARAFRVVLAVERLDAKVKELPRCSSLMPSKMACTCALVPRIDRGAFSATVRR
jgi:hypothetical protein